MNEQMPHLMMADALKLKATAEQLAAVHGGNAQIAVSAKALLSLIEQAHSPNLGFATTRHLRTELEIRDRDPVSRADNYRTVEAPAS